MSLFREPGAFAAKKLIFSLLRKKRPNNPLEGLGHPGGDLAAVLHALQGLGHPGSPPVTPGLPRGDLAAGQHALEGLGHPGVTPGHPGVTPG